MTNTEMITAVSLAIFSKVFEMVFEKIVAPYIPERKKLISYTRKFFEIAFLFILPIAVIAWLMLSDIILDKKFVFLMAIYCGLLIMNGLSYKLRTVVKTLNAHSKDLITVKNISSDLMASIGFERPKFGDSPDQSLVKS